MTEEKKFSVDEAHKEFAVKTNGRIWALLEKEGRSQLEDDELLYAAYASCYHWSQIGTGVHRQRGEYLISKAYTSLQLPAEALRHARRCLTLTNNHQDEMADFDIAYAHECLARAYAMNGHEEDALKHYEMAKAAGEDIKDSEDKKIFGADMASGDWFGLDLKR